MAKVLIINLLLFIILLEGASRILVASNLINIFDKFDLNSVSSRWTIFNDELGLWHNKNMIDHHEGLCFKAKYTFNSEGMRMREQADLNEEHVLIIGDSIVEGYGISDDETLSYLLQKKTQLNVINLAVAGAHPINYLKAIKKYFNDKTQKVLVFIYLGNDLDDLYDPNTRAGYYLKKENDAFVIKNSSYKHSKAWERLGGFRKMIFGIYNQSYFLRFILHKKMVVNHHLRKSDSEQSYAGFNYIISKIKDIIPNEKLQFYLIPDHTGQKEVIKKLKEKNSFTTFDNINFKDLSLYFECDRHFKAHGIKEILKEIKI